MNKIIWFTVGSIILTLAAIVFLRQDLVHLTFNWLLNHPFIPVSASLALWAIISLLGEKNLRKATWLELAAVGTLFHQDFSAFLISFLYSLSNFWRAF